jgi:hypothetical protein
MSAEASGQCPIVIRRSHEASPPRDAHLRGADVSNDISDWQLR